MNGTKNALAVVVFYATTRIIGCRRLTATYFTVATPTAAKERMSSGQLGSARRGEWVSRVTYYHLSELIMCGQPGHRAPGAMPGEVEPFRRTQTNLFRGWHAGKVPKDDKRGSDPEWC